MSTVTEVVLVVDRSGSMSALRKGTVEGINNFIREVRETPGEGCWTLLFFDDHDSAKGANETFPQVILDRVPDAEVKDLTEEEYRPRGSTALIDAVCFAIQRTKERLSQAPADPAKEYKVLFVIVTDGHENASKEWTNAKMRELVAEAENKYKWSFMYLGANQDAFAESEKHGIATRAFHGAGGQSYSNKVNYGASNSGVLGAFKLASAGSRAWKAEGNQTVESLLSPAAPEDLTSAPEPNPAPGTETSSSTN